MFRGANAINLDTKGRLAIPTKYRQSLLDDCQGQLVCTVDTQQSCLLLYPLPEWEEILGYASEGEMDKSGRILVPTPLRSFAKLSKEVMLVGQLNKFEIWDADIWAQQVEADIDTERKGEFELTERLQDFSL